MARREAVPFGTYPFAARTNARPHPAPSAPSPSYVAMLRFALPRPAAARVAVWTTDGACVRTILEGDLAAGEHACAWNGRDAHEQPVAPGHYTVRIEADARVLATRRVEIG